MIHVCVSNRREFRGSNLQLFISCLQQATSSNFATKEILKAKVKERERRTTAEEKIHILKSKTSTQKSIQTASIIQSQAASTAQSLSNSPGKHCFHWVFKILMSARQRPHEGLGKNASVEQLTGMPQAPGSSSNTGGTSKDEERMPQ